MSDRGFGGLPTAPRTPAAGPPAGRTTTAWELPTPAVDAVDTIPTVHTADATGTDTAETLRPGIATGTGPARGIAVAAHAAAGEPWAPVPTTRGGADVGWGDADGDAEG
ncbi:hypothetical protein, partial [Streptomyces fuscigenes]|uniref:hypothetical protein n=1 Tax=Streptomyces fuscigenes TaxID=1528880 RepID=UPI0027E1963A